MDITNINIKKIYWPDIRKEVETANIEFFHIVEKINPGIDCPLYILNFPYGELIGDNISQFLPLKNGGQIRLNDPSIPDELLKDLGYGKNNSPMGMILNKNFELYVDLPNKKTTLPFRVQNPGDFFSYTRTLNIEHNFNYAPNGVLSMMSGMRSAFVLPSIGCTNKFSKMCRLLKIREPKPISTYDHCSLFKSLLNSESIHNSWCSSLIYFSEKWINNIKYDANWYELQQYFFKLFTKKSQYPINLQHYNTAYSLLLEKTNLKPNPYLLDTFKHLMDIMVGEAPGFAPTINDDDLPLDLLQDIFIHSYGLKNIFPTIMSPRLFNIRQKNSNPIYYSLQLPTTSSFSPKSKNSSVMVDMRELNYLFTKLNNELIKNDDFCSNTIIQYVAQNLDASFFHNSDDIDGIISHIGDLINQDSRFRYITEKNKNNHMLPAEDAKFFRGCVKISWKSN